MQISKKHTELLIGVISLLFFIPFVGRVPLFDWDEINFAECAREMMLLKEYTRVYIDFVPFWEKPPLFIWFQVLSMKVFGISEFAARLPNAILSAFTLILLYRIGKRLYDHKFGLIWVFAYGGSILPCFYFGFAIIDPLFNFFIFLSVYYLILFVWKKDNEEGISLNKWKYSYLLIAGTMSGLAVLTKGPVGFLIVCLTLGVYWIMKRFRFFINVPEFLVFTIFMTLVSCVWYGVETAINGPWFVAEFLKYNYRLFSTPDAGHGGFPGYHFVVILIGCFPASLFFLGSFRKLPTEYKYQKDFQLWMKILFWVVLILFTIVKSKIVHYSSLTYFPLTFLAATVIYNAVIGKVRIPSWIKFSVFFLGTLLSVLLIILPFVGLNIDQIIPLIDDEFAQANMQAKVNWTGFEACIGFILFLSLISGMVKINQRNWKMGLFILFFGTAVVTRLTFIISVYNIEQITQRASIDFYKSFIGKDVYVKAIGFHSYGQHFYRREQPITNEKYYDLNWLATGDVDKPVFFIAKIHKQDWFKDKPQIKKIGEKNGFVFYKRME